MILFPTVAYKEDMVHKHEFSWLMSYSFSTYDMPEIIDFIIKNHFCTLIVSLASFKRSQTLYIILWLEEVWPQANDV